MTAAHAHHFKRCGRVIPEWFVEDLPDLSSKPVLSDAAIAYLQQRLLEWYEVNRRDLPWRGATDPYAILVSEVMLQQTGVDRVIPYYQRFLELFPSFEALAEAPRIEVLRAWAGLGYNRRAVNLHECAKSVVREHGGRLPDDPEALRRLPGLGPYTVAAVLSFVFHRDVPTLDTNVRRVVGRIARGYPVGDRDLRDIAAQLVPAGRSSDWNQALMDFGSAYCTASNPRCLFCPVRERCAAVSGDGYLDARWSKKVAEKAESYQGSRRFYRGRIVARLRDLSAGEWITLGELLGDVKPGHTAADFTWIAELVEALAAEGLASVVQADGGMQVAAPG